MVLVGAGAKAQAELIAGTALETLSGAPRQPAVRLAAKDPALITHSSGTTGLPKLAVHCPNALWNRLLPQQVMGWPSRGETAALCVSYVHSRFYHALGVFLGYGSPLVLLVDHEPARVGPLLARLRPGIVETHPNTFVLWEELADAPGGPLSNVGFYGSTFDAIHPRTIQRLLGASRRSLRRAHPALRAERDRPGGGQVLHPQGRGQGERPAGRHRPARLHPGPGRGRQRPAVPAPACPGTSRYAPAAAS